MVGKNEDAVYKNLGAFVRRGVLHKKALESGADLGDLPLAQTTEGFTETAISEADKQIEAALGLWGKLKDPLFIPSLS